MARHLQERPARVAAIRPITAMAGYLFQFPLNSLGVLDKETEKVGKGGQSQSPLMSDNEGGGMSWERRSCVVRKMLGVCTFWLRSRSQWKVEITGSIVKVTPVSACRVRHIIALYLRLKMSHVTVTLILFSFAFLPPCHPDKLP